MKKSVFRLSSVFALSCVIILGACGDDSKDSSCPAGQDLVQVGASPAQCLSPCNAGVCGAGEMCTSGYCVSTTGNPNNQNNTNNNNTTVDPNNTNNNTTVAPNNTNNNTTVDPNNTNNNPDECVPSTLAGACDVVCQTGCAAGQSCAITGGTASAPQTGCVGTGTAGEGEECSGANLCEVGMMCVPESQGAQTGTCIKFCRPSGGEPSCATGDVCAPITQDGSAGICETPEDECTQFPNDSCAEGQNCYLTQIGLRCAPFNANASAGDTCAGPDQCNDEQVCTSTMQGGNATCSDMCELGSTDQCAAGQTCQGINTPNGPAPFGVCTAMM